MNIAVCIPTINRADLLNEALAIYDKCWPTLKIFILDNGNQVIHTKNENQIVIKSDSNIGVAASWNFLSEIAFSEGFMRCLILNDDIILDIDENELHRALNKYADHSIVVQNGNWCSFILPKVVFDTIGPFDEHFYPAYYEDNDYMYRIKLDKHCDIQVDNILNPTTYRNSMSIQKEPTLNKFSKENLNYYISKWGGRPSEETFLSEFNTIPTYE